MDKIAKLLPPLALPDLEAAARPWVSASSAPFAHLVGPEVAFVIPCFLAFSSIFLLLILLYPAPGLPLTKRATLASSGPSFCHGILTVLAAGYQLYVSLPYRLDTPNTEFTEWLMMLSFAYFVSDVVCYLLWFDRDILFVGHHVMTCSYMAWCYALGRGGISALVLMFWGELTSPCQNTWFFIKEQKTVYRWAAAVFTFVSPGYTLYYIFIRSVVAPAVVVGFVRSMVTDTKTLPVTARLYFCFCAIAGVAGSQVWSYRLSRGFYKKFVGKGRKPLKAE